MSLFCPPHENSVYHAINFRQGHLWYCDGHIKAQGVAVSISTSASISILQPPLSFLLLQILAPWSSSPLSSHPSPDPRHHRHISSTYQSALSSRPLRHPTLDPRPHRHSSLSQSPLSSRTLSHSFPNPSQSQIPFDLSIAGQLTMEGPPR